MSTYIQTLQSLLAQSVNPAEAVPMSRYMRDQFPFLGIKTPARRTVLKEFIAAYGLPQPNDLEAILHELWALPEREYQYSALTFLDRLIKKQPPEFVSVLEYLIVTKSWWDTVDSVAGGSVAIHFQRYPLVRETAVAAWRISDNFWLRRTPLLFQLSYKTQTDADLLFSLIRENLDSDEFFIQKAVGWALREYSKTNADAVVEFIAATPLAPLSAREGLRTRDASKTVPPRHLHTKIARGNDRYPSNKKRCRILSDPAPFALTAVSTFRLLTPPTSA